MRNSRGLTVIELLVAVSIVALASGAVTRAYTSAMAFEVRAGQARERLNAKVGFEDTVDRLVGGADLHSGSGYFVSPIPNSAAGFSPPGQNRPLGQGSASLVLTTSPEPPSLRYLTTRSANFQDLNQRFGPEGGATEVAFSLNPTGDAGPKRGLFKREQRPPDGDLTQGGQERLVNPDLTDIRFEFYDGTSWMTTWDSRDAQKDKLPSAVRVTYTVKSESKPRQFLVRVRMSFLAPGGVQAPSGTGGGAK